MEHRNRHIFAPFFKDIARRDAAVLLVDLPMRRPWQEYGRYWYIWGMGLNLNKIPRHNWHSVSSALEHLSRLQRLVEFMDKTGFTPVDEIENTEIVGRVEQHSGVELLNNPDHRSYWIGPCREPLVLVEPYTPCVDIEEEIQACELTAVILPHPGIYGGADGKSTSIFLTTPQHAAVLRSLEGFQFTRPTVTPVSVRWADALNHSKGYGHD